jgi:hypothetical protein
MRLREDGVVTELQPPLPNDDGLGFAFDADGVAARQRLADELVGHTLSGVVYLTMDLTFGDRTGLYPSDLADFQDPPWQFTSFHSIDFGIEFELDNGAKYFVTWDNPGRIESLRLARGDMSDEASARWDVTAISPWDHLRTAPIMRFDLDYAPWSPDGGFWCRTVTITAGSVVVTIDGAEADGPDSTTPSADNLVVTYKS